MPFFSPRKSVFRGGDGTAWKEDVDTRVRPYRDSLSFQMRCVEESQPRESMALNPSQKQVREQKGNNIKDF